MAAEKCGTYTTGVDYSALALPTANYAERFNNEFVKHYSEAEDTTVDPACSRQDTDALLNCGECKINEGPDVSDVPMLDIKYQYARWQKATCAAAAATLPQKQSGKLLARDISDRTRNLIKNKDGMDPKKSSAADFTTAQAAIKESSLQDYKDWVNKNV